MSRPRDRSTLAAVYARCRPRSFGTILPTPKRSNQRLVPAVSVAQHHDLTHEGAAVDNAAVGFGVFPALPSLGTESLCLVLGTSGRNAPVPNRVGRRVWTRQHFLNDWMFGFVNVVGGN